MKTKVGNNTWYHPMTDNYMVETNVKSRFFNFCLKVRIIDSQYRYKACYATYDVKPSLLRRIINWIQRNFK